MRLLPQNTEAEDAVIGACMLGFQSAIDDAKDIIDVSDFYRPVNGEIFAAMLDLSAKSEPVDLLTLKTEMVRRGIMADADAQTYLLTLGDRQFTIANVVHYAKIVKATAQRRKLIEIAAELTERAYSPVDESEALMEIAEAKVLSLIDSNRGDNHGEMVPPLLVKAMESFDVQQHQRGKIVGVSTGFTTLDFTTSGAQNGDLWIIAARPSMGKTSIATQIFTHMCRRGLSPVFASLEMSRKKLSQRIICAEARVNSQEVRIGNATDDDWRRMSEATERLWGTKGFIDDKPAATLTHLKSVCRRHRAKHGLHALFVDYLGLMEEDSTGRGRGGSENQNQKVTNIVKGLKNIAREFDIPVFALCQLSRNVERRDDKRPMMSDLRDSGSIESEADIIAFPHRPSYYDKSLSVEDTTVERAELIIAKQRDGPTKTLDIGFVAAYARFENIKEEFDPHGKF